MTVLLAGDIGGTKTILRLVDAQTSGTTTEASLKPLYENRYVSGEFPDLVPMVRQFLAEAQEKLGSVPAPERACFAIAGPVADNASSLTNLSWLLEGDRLEKDLGISKVALINDFAAIGYGVLGMSEDDICSLQSTDHTPSPTAPIAVIGAGTGLGEGFLVPSSPSRYQVYPSEGGHADFAPRSQTEFELLRYLLDKFGITRISAERVVSGQGIVAIYQFLRDRQMGEESPEIAEVVRIWEREKGVADKSVDPAATIAIAAAEENDHLSERTMKIFASAYGAEAGNLALKLLPYGGLYIAGGIAAKNLALLQSGEFMSAFLEKGRVSSLLENIPVNIVLNPSVGLIGAALYATMLE